MTGKKFLLFLSYAYSRLMLYIAVVPFEILWLVGKSIQSLSLSFRQSLVVDNFRTRIWLDFLQRKFQTVSTRVQVLDQELYFTYSSSQEFWRIKTIAMKETDTVDWISRMAKIHPNATLVDVGANIGIYSILWLRVSNGKVICVEPLPSNVLSLINNMKKNKMVNRSQVVQAVATSETKIVDFYSPSIMPGEGFGSALVPRNYPADNYNFLVMGVPISSLHFASEELIVKVDVEGSELEVVRGLELFFQAGRIRSVIFEKNDGSKQVLEYLATHNLIEETGTGIGNIICNLVG